MSIGDFGGLGTDFPFIISEKAYLLMKEFVCHDAELRKVKVIENGNYSFVYRPSNVIDCLDMKSSIIESRPGGYKRLIKPVFDNSKLKNGLIFIVPQFMTNSLFVTEDVAEKLKASDLTGYILVDASIPRN